MYSLYMYLWLFPWYKPLPRIKRRGDIRGHDLDRENLY